MAGSPLMVHSTISVQTNEGCRQIHLCFGDITSTSSLRCLGSVAEDGDTNTSFTNEPADVILISAFQGKYVQYHITSKRNVDVEIIYLPQLIGKNHFDLVGWISHAIATVED